MRQKLKKNWTENPRECVANYHHGSNSLKLVSSTELAKPWRIFLTGCKSVYLRIKLLLTELRYSVKERLKDVLRQYELRERHFECVIRSKELEVLLSRARAAEQKRLVDEVKARADKLDEEVCLARLLHSGCHDLIGFADTKSSKTAGRRSK